MRVVVSLTTIPARVKYLGQILSCLQHQTYLPDCIYLNLPFTSRRENRPYPDLPSNLDLTHVMVNRCPDLGPITKLAPTLEKELDPDTIIITVDDDMEYRSDRIETLVRWCQQYPEAAIGGGGYIIGRSWNDFFGAITQPKELTSVSVIEGNSGCAYRRRFFQEDLLDYTGAPKEAFYHDDVWISGYLALRNIKRMVHPEKFGIFNSLPNGLSHERLACARRFFPVVKYFQDRGVLNEFQTAPYLNIMGFRVILAILLILLLIGIILYLFWNPGKLFPGNDFTRKDILGINSLT